jgi:thymidylate synthase (FAD)
MNVTLNTYTNRPLFVCATAARTCYSQDEPEMIGLSYNEAVKLIKRVMKSGHHSVLEHASFIFHISGVSRALTHQLVRHRMASYSQQSQRYVSMKEPDYVVPNTIDNLTSVDSGELHAARELFEQGMNLSWKIYNQMIELGVPREDARYILPNACCTNIVVTMNARELIHFFSLRMCNRAQWEIRELAVKMYEECMKVAPEIFEYAGPGCWNEGCTESNPCGNPPQRGNNV